VVVSLCYQEEHSAVRARSDMVRSDRLRPGSGKSDSPTENVCAALLRSGQPLRSSTTWRSLKNIHVTCRSGPMVVTTARHMLGVGERIAHTPIGVDRTSQAVPTAGIGVD